MNAGVADGRKAFIQKLGSTMKEANEGGKPVLVFIRCVERPYLGNCAAAIETAFARIQWTKLDLDQHGSWAKLQAMDPNRVGGAPRGIMLAGMPRDDAGNIERQAVRELSRLRELFLSPSSIVVFLVTPPEVDAVIKDADALWLGRAGYLSWPERSSPLVGANPHGEDAPSGPSESGDTGSFHTISGRSEVQRADPAEVLLAAGTLFQSGEYDHAGGHAIQALTSYSARHDHLGVGEAAHLLGMIAERRNDLGSAVGWYEKALESYGRVDDTLLQQALVEERLGEIQYRRGDLERALTRFRRALEKDEKRRDEVRMASGFRHLAVVVERMDKLGMADNFLRRSLELEQEQDNKQGLARCYLHLGRIKHRLGDVMEAHENLTNAQSLCEELEDMGGLSAVFHEFGNGELAQQLYPEAVKWYKRALEVDLERGDKRAVARVHAQLGHTFMEAGSAEPALRNLLIAHESSSLLGSALAQEVMQRIRELRKTFDKDAYERIKNEVAGLMESGEVEAL